MIYIAYIFEDFWSTYYMILRTQDKMGWVSGSEPQLHVGFTTSSILCLNLCPFRWLNFSLKRVSNLMPLLSWVWKPEFSEALTKLSNAFLKDIGKGDDFTSSFKVNTQFIFLCNPQKQRYIVAVAGAVYSKKQAVYLRH